MIKNCEVSVVIPILNEEECLQELYKRLISVLEKKMGINYEIIFIEDGGMINRGKLLNPYM